ncbi:MAG: hypothetical protein U1E65_33765 [Myxococcota bacterium]
MNKLLRPLALSAALLGTACSTTGARVAPDFGGAGIASAAAPERETKSKEHSPRQERLTLRNTESRRLDVGAIGPGPRPAPERREGSR